ncbi:VENN motif pre-toxin domain-containing protein [Pantoea ananatis]|nr:VENN motif pre-toxin domain-containing protein [Pantoea ananatis]UYK91329.1 VENN motif pre-toxin domain-containing protein [Pantoea ananatis]
MGTTLRPSTQPHRARVIVGNHPQLDGAVIASTADKDRNVLDTGTLGWRNIQNQADYKSEHQSAGFNSGGPIGSNLLSNVSALPVSAAGGSGHAEGSTKAAVSDGNIIIRNRDAQQQDLSGLSRDTEHANDGSISPIFDKEKEQRRLQQAQLVNDVATQALDVYNTHEAARATRAATASLADTDTRTALEAQASAMLDKAHEKDPNVDNSRQAVVSKAWQLAYDQAIVRQGADMGGSVRTGVNAVVNALQALAGGDIRAALVQGAAPYLAAKVKELTTGNAPYGELTDTQKLNNLMAHALLGGVVAELSGGSAAAGATGAITGELATPAIALALYGTADSDKLSPEQKANLSALATLASGIAAGVSSGSTAGAATGALAGKNSVENNFLGATSSDKLDKAVEKIKNGDKTLATANELIKLENADKRSDALVSKFTKDPSQMSSTERAELTGYLRIYAAEMENAYGPAVAQQLVTGQLSGQDYMKRDPDSEAMSKAQSIMNTWGYHKSNASIGDAPLMFGGIMLGTTIKGMAANVAIGVGVNTGVQLAGKDPFSYVDVIMAGVTAAATTGKGIIVSTPVNMGGAVVGNAIKGEDPTGSAIAAGAGSIFGGVAGKLATEQLKPVIKEGSAEIIGTVTGGTVSEITGKNVQDALNNAGGKNGKN